MIQIKRVYEKIDVRDGMRVLIDGLWPRGIRSASPNIDIWLKDVAPSADLRKWFSHDPGKWLDFKKQYKEELKANKGLEKLIKLAQENDALTLLYASKDTEHNNAVVLLEVINIRLGKDKPST
jgi:uncharacterized protein YeaO (DUF488 family)